MSKEGGEEVKRDKTKLDIQSFQSLLCPPSCHCQIKYGKKGILCIKFCVLTKSQKLKGYDQVIQWSEKLWQNYEKLFKGCFQSSSK